MADGGLRRSGARAPSLVSDIAEDLALSGVHTSLTPAQLGCTATELLAVK